jgi:hypothetical protein
MQRILAFSRGKTTGLPQNQRLFRPKRFHQHPKSPICKAQLSPLLQGVTGWHFCKTGKSVANLHHLWPNCGNTMSF